MNVVAFVADLMDRSRITSARPGTRFATSPADAAGADVVVVDLARFADAVGPIRAAAPSARLVAFGPHVDDDALTAARAVGADVVMPRSRFFRDVSAAIAPATDR